MICNKNGCMSECRIKDNGEEERDGIKYTKQIYWCVKCGDRYEILRNEKENSQILSEI